MPMIDPTTMTSMEICSVTTTPCRRRGSSLMTGCIAAPSHRPANAPLKEAEHSGDRIGGDEVEHGGRRPSLDVLERIRDQLPGHERQLRDGDGHSQRRVFEERDEGVSQGWEHDAK